ncbi:hypothetical protein MWU78_21920 [Arenibacter sp. F26102]|uniref:hypothetical protein n=1 Tax=Arenibacter sp. F26102 TaxID=2926416 RepID=UPI001FF3BC8A|nr:hypothetical protein [Arenibacter sp. F26102]MCK0148316.1 hypothetical protein [Arenibacter sp. F26102]
MLIEDANRDYINIGKITCWITFSFGLVYLFITFIGFLSLSSSEEPIGDPYFTIMELLAIIIALLMAISMIAVHYHASAKYKLQSLFALCSMFVMAGITSSVHFVVLTMSYQLETTTMDDLTLLFSFKWPSVVYTLDILAWDWFFSLSFLLAAPIFNNGKMEKTIRALMLISGVLSLIGILGVPFNDMQIRNIGIIGYAVIAPFVFLLIGINFSQIDRNKKTNAQHRV